MSKGEKIEIRMTLDGAVAERFTWLKDRFGVRNNSEMLRLLISLVYRTEKEMGYLGMKAEGQGKAKMDK